MRMASVLLPPLSIVPINQKAICDAALSPRMSKMWQMMITWGKSMLITILLMVPLQEQHPSKYKSGKIHRLWKSTNLELALCQVIHLITEVWERAVLKKKAHICYLVLFLTSNILNKKKTNLHCLILAVWIQSRCYVRAAGESLAVVLQIERQRKGRGVKYLIVHGCRITEHFFRVKNILTHHLFPSPYLRSTRGNELSGTDFSYAFVFLLLLCGG